jgi:1-acyl-sn-glycerol-3-phosphate acyltransferase
LEWRKGREVETFRSEEYSTKTSWYRRLIFWLVFVVETLRHRRLSRLIKARLGRGWQAQIEGLENLPKQGVFILAVNHYRGSLTLDVLASVLASANQVRPDLANNYVVVSGRRTPRRAKPILPARFLRKIVEWVFRRWAQHHTQIMLSSANVSIKALRNWRTRVQQQPVLVFPEGKASLQFKQIRPSAGRWLAALPVPVVPVGIWWYAGIWQLRFGPPLNWSHRQELRDFQLGLTIANLLPADLAPDWQLALTDWRAAHNISTVNNADIHSKDSDFCAII